MNIIMFSSQSAQAQKIVLTKLHLTLVAIVFLLLALLLALGLNYLALRYADRIDIPVLRTLLVNPHEERHQQVQSQLHDNLNVMAAKLGKMQAHFLRLDALSVQLLESAGLEADDFMLDESPGQGGAYLDLNSEAMTFDEFEQKLHAQSARLDERADKLFALESLLRNKKLTKRVLPSVMPVDTDWYSSGFGARIDPFTGRRAFHEGVDFAVKTGTPIRATAGGVVVYSDRHAEYGNMVEIDHGDDLISRYAHASKLHVELGQVVAQGQKIAEVGSTGRSTGPHLHFEIRHKDVPQNPSRFLKKPG